MREPRTYTVCYSTPGEPPLPVEIFTERADARHFAKLLGAPGFHDPDSECYRRVTIITRRGE